MQAGVQHVSASAQVNVQICVEFGEVAIQNALKLSLLRGYGVWLSAVDSFITEKVCFPKSAIKLKWTAPPENRMHCCISIYEKP